MIQLIHQGAGGSGGGGTGSISNSASRAINGSAGTANTGGGGGGTGSNVVTSYAGGSGVVILRYSDGYTLSNSGGGLTFTTATVGSDKVTTFTAGTGTCSFS